MGRRPPRGWGGVGVRGEGAEAGPRLPGGWEELGDAPPPPPSPADIITLKSGEKINPTPIEERVKRHVPLARYVTLVGQDAPYLCALLTLKVPSLRSAPHPPEAGRGGRPGLKRRKLRLGEIPPQGPGWRGAVQGVGRTVLVGGPLGIPEKVAGRAGLCREGSASREPHLRDGPP